MEWCLTSFTAILLVSLCVIPNSFSPCVWLSVSQRETGERICFDKKESPNNLLQAVSILFEESCVLLSLFFLLSPTARRHDECSVKQIYRYNVDIEWRGGSGFPFSVGRRLLPFR
jgi:hypothetical protein